MLANDGNRLGGGNVVARRPVVFSGAVEIFLDKLLSSRQSESSAHDGKLWQIEQSAVAPFTAINLSRIGKKLALKQFAFGWSAAAKAS